MAGIHPKAHANQLLLRLRDGPVLRSTIERHSPNLIPTVNRMLYGTGKRVVSRAIRVTGRMGIALPDREYRMVEA